MIRLENGGKGFWDCADNLSGTGKQTLEIMKMNNRDKVDLVTAMFETLVAKVGLHETMVGIHNAFVHGELLDNTGYDFEEIDLEELYKHLEGLTHVSKRLSNA